VFTVIYVHYHQHIQINVHFAGLMMFILRAECRMFYCSGSGS
jgi:hypothetical protein